MKELGKSFLFFGLATSIEAMLGFALLPFYTKIFNPTEYGVLDLMAVLLAILSVFGTLQLETALQRYYYEVSTFKKKVLITNVIFVVFVLSSITGLFVFAFSETISSLLFHSVNYSSIISLLSIQIPLLNVSVLLLLLLRYEKNNLNFLKTVIVKVILMIALVYFLVFYYELRIKGVLLAQIIALFISSSLAFYYNSHLFVNIYSNSMLKRNFKYALPQFPARIGSVLLGQANRFFILQILSLTSIGIFSISMKIASAMQLANVAFIMAWAPFMHQQFKNENNKEVFKQVLPFVSSIVFLIVCIFSIFSSEFVSILVSNDYLDSSKYVGGLTLFFALYIVKECIDIGPKITEKTKFLSYNFVVSLLVNFITLYLFTNAFELKGVVFAMISTNLVLVLVSWFTSSRLYPINFDKLYFLILFLPALIIAIVSMFINIYLGYKLLICFAILLFYGLFFYKSYKQIKKLI